MGDGEDDPHDQEVLFRLKSRDVYIPFQWCFRIYISGRLVVASGVGSRLKAWEAPGSIP